MNENYSVEFREAITKLMIYIKELEKYVDNQREIVKKTQKFIDLYDEAREYVEEQIEILTN